MLLDELLILFKTKSDTSGADKMNLSLDGVEKSAAKAEDAAHKATDSLDEMAKSTDKAGESAKKTGDSFSKSFTKAIVSITAVAGLIKTAMLSAWTYLDGTIDKIESLQDAEDESIRTSKEQVEQAKKYRENMEKMGKTIDNIKIRIAASFLPAMLQMSQVYADFLDKNKDLIENGIKKVLSWVEKLSQILSNFARFIELVIEKTVGWEGALYILGAALLWINRAMVMAFATNPITWIVAALAGLILLIDDFMTYLDGGDSLFGEYWGGLVDWIEKVKEPLETLKSTFLEMFDVVSDAFDSFISGFSENFNLAEVFGFDQVTKDGEETEGFFVGFIEILTKLFQFIVDNKETIKSVAEFIGKAFAWLLKLIIGVFSGAIKVAAGFIEYVLASFDMISAIFSGNTEAMSKAWDKLGSAIKKILSGVWDFIAQILDSILQLFGSSLEDVANYFTDLYAKIIAVFDKIVSDVKSKFSEMISDALSAVSGIGDAFSKVFEMITAPFSKAFDWVSDKLGGLGSMISSSISGTVSGISDKVGAAISNTTKTVNNYGGNVDAKINVSSANPSQAAEKTVSQLKSANGFANRNLAGAAKA